MAKKMNLGKVGMTAAGSYQSGKAYERLTCVSYNHESWVSRKDVPAGVAPAEGSEYWQKMASRGEQGPQGQSYVDKELVPIVDNLTTGGSSNVLSAEQGKVLKAELTELESEVNEIKLDIRDDADITNLFLWSDGQTINTSSGNILSSQVNSVSDFVKVIGADSLRLMVNKATSGPQDGGLCFYNENKEYISGIRCEWGAEEKTIIEKTYTIPTGAVYIRTQIYTDFKSGFYCIAFNSQSILHQISNMQNEINDIHPQLYIGDVTDKSNDVVWTDNQTINAASGVIITSSVNSVSDYIATDNYRKITLSVNKSTTANQVGGICFYDENKQFISGIACEWDTELSESTIVTNSYDIPVNAAYFRTQIFTKFKYMFQCFLGEKVSLKESIIQIQKDINKPSIIARNYTFMYDFVSDSYDKKSISGTYSIVENGMLLTNGFANAVIFDKWISATNCKVCADILLTNLDTSVCLSTREADNGPHATMVEFDFENRVMKVYPKSNGLSLPSSSLKEIQLTNINSMRYIIEFGRKEREVYAAITNYNSNERQEIVISEANDIDYPAGWLHDYLLVSQLKGSACYVRRFYGVLPRKDVVFLGDSITEGLRVEYKDCWCKLVIDAIGGGIDFGSSGGRVSNCQKVVDTILPAVKPKFVVVTIGTNGGNTLDNLTGLKESIEQLGAIPIFNHIAFYSDAATTNAINQDIAQLNCDGARFDLATSINNDVSQGQNAALFVDDKVHPNEDGHRLMAERFLTDVPYLVA